MSQGKYEIFLVQGQNKGSAEIIALLKANPQSGDCFKVTLVASRADAERNRLTGVPAIRSGANTAYGTDAIVAIKKILAQTKELEDACNRADPDCGAALSERNDFDIDVSKITKDNFDPSMFHIKDDKPSTTVNYAEAAEALKKQRQSETFFP
jgi:hypothetical protein